MIIFFYGPDTWRQKADVRRAAQLWQQKHPGTVPTVFEVSEGLDDLEHAVRYPSLLDAERFFILNGTFSSAATAQDVLNILAAHGVAQDSHTTLLIAEPSDEKTLAAKGKTLFSFLRSHADPVTTHPFLTGNGLERWVTEQCRASGCTIDPDAVRELVQRVGNESWTLASEIAKLSGFTRSGAIQLADVRELVAGPVDLNIFDLTDALAAKDRGRALELLYRELAGGRDPYYLLTMIIFQFRNLLVVKDLAARGMAVPAIAKASGIHPFVAKKAFGQSQKFQDSDLKRIYHKLFVLDTEAKTGAVDLPSSLNTLILGL